MKIENQTDEPVVYKAEGDDPTVGKLVRLLLKLLFLLPTAAWHLVGHTYSILGRSTTSSASEPILGFCMGKLCGGVLMTGKYQIQSSSNYKYTVTVTCTRHFPRSGRLEQVDAQDGDLIFTEEFVLKPRP
jgi:hypothetical protein